MLGEGGVDFADVRVVQAGAHDCGLQIVVANDLRDALQPNKGVLVCAQKPVAVLRPQRLFVAVLGARQRHAEDPRSPPPALGCIKRGRTLKEVHLCFFTRRMLHDVDQLRVLPLESPHVAPHRGVLVRVGFELAQILVDALRRQSLTKTCLDLRTVRLGDTRWPMRLTRAGRHVVRF